MLATVEALCARLGVESLSTLDQARAEAALEDASALVTGVLTTVPAPVPDVVATVVLRAAAREFRNPTGATNRSAIAFSESLTVDAANGVYLTETEMAILRPYMKYKGLISVPVTRPELDHSQFRVPVIDTDGVSGQPLPWPSVDD